MPCARCGCLRVRPVVPLTAAEAVHVEDQERPGGPRAIRPTTPLRSPQQVANELNRQELALYRMVWQRTLASQMADATGTTVTVRLGATAADGTDAEFGASGTTITFAGYRQVYVESRDDGDGDSDGESEALLPPLAQGDDVAVARIEPQGHTTSPPARYTEASLIKRLEELGIGRPSTWASIIQTIQDRGYVWKKGQAPIPTWTAFAVVGLMEQHFDDLVDYEFTARVETDLDAIAAGERQKDQWLRSFYFGDDRPASNASSRRTSTRSTPRRSTRSPSASTPTVTRWSSNLAGTGRTSSAATTRPAFPTTFHPTS